jgi:hypothetical protein
MSDEKRIAKVVIIIKLSYLNVLPADRFIVRRATAMKAYSTDVYLHARIYCCPLRLCRYSAAIERAGTGFVYI